MNLTPIIEYFDDDSDTWKSIEHDKPDLKLSTHYPQSIGAPKSGLSPQMVDSIATDYNSFKPCHYTKIEASVEGGKTL